MFIFKESDKIKSNQIEPNSTEGNEESIDTEFNNESKKHNYSSISDLLLWAIFANRTELAEICWLRGTDHLCKFFLKVFRFVLIIGLCWYVRKIACKAYIYI